jgi:formylmethanofuran dehydrogenase subunit E
MPEEVFLDIGPIMPYVLERKKGIFTAQPCARCGELTFIDKLVDDGDGLVCLACHESAA